MELFRLIRLLAREGSEKSEVMKAGFFFGHLSASNEKVLHLFVGSWMNAFTCCKVVAKSLSKGKVFWKTLP
jgi:hypothetical protein